MNFAAALAQDENQQESSFEGKMFEVCDFQSQVMKESDSRQIYIRRDVDTFKCVHLTDRQDLFNMSIIF